MRRRILEVTILAVVPVLAPMAGCQLVLGLGDLSNAPDGSMSERDDSGGIVGTEGGAADGQGVPPGGDAEAGVEGGGGSEDGEAVEASRLDGSTGADADASPPACAATTERCNDGQPQQCVAGVWQDFAACTGSTPVCLGGTCVACNPNLWQCDGLQTELCDSTGTWQVLGGSCTGSGGCDAGFCVCSATIAAGALTTLAGTGGTGGYQSVVGNGGYTFAYSDSNGSPPCTTSPTTICIEESAICVSGTTGVSSTTCFGAGFGFNVGQQSGSTNKNYAVPSTSTGISYSLSKFPASVEGMRLEVTVGGIGGSGGVDYCAVITAASGSVPWTSLQQTCYAAAPGPALAGPPTNLTQVEFSIQDGPAPVPFDFCVTSLSF